MYSNNSEIIIVLKTTSTRTLYLEPIFNLFKMKVYFPSRVLCASNEGSLTRIN